MIIEHNKAISRLLGDAQRRLSTVNRRCEITWRWLRLRIEMLRAEEAGRTEVLVLVKTRANERNLHKPRDATTANRIRHRPPLTHNDQEADHTTGESKGEPVNGFTMQHKESTILRGDHHRN
ncbi:unnamed protein product [Linum trigynum]|uniref:Uncharacterized protein n=1 Tax=Linum trigynum TaxID=586398 RepID=A0AAV2E8S0_9ROSI